MTTNVTGQGWKLERGAATGASLPAAGSDSFSQVLDIEELVPPSATRDIEERFVLDQIASKKFPGPISWNPVTAKLLFADGDSVHDTLLADSYATPPAARRNYRVSSLSSTIVFNFVGFVTKFEFDSVTNQGVVAYNLEIAVDGSVTIS
jgi:hypothetical protein